MTMRPLAQINLGTLKGLGPLGNVTSTTDAFFKFTGVLSVAIGILTIAAGIWFIIQIFMGAFQWLSSGGEKQGIENARKRITNAIVGLFVVIASYALISLVGLVFGFNILSPIGALLGFPTSPGLPFSLPAPGGSYQPGVNIQ